MSDKPAESPRDVMWGMLRSSFEPEKGDTVVAVVTLVNFEPGKGKELRCLTRFVASELKNFMTPDEIFSLRKELCIATTDAIQQSIAKVMAAESIQSPNTSLH